MHRGSLYQKETCTRISLEANIALTLGKLWAGIFGHSQAMIADALHSLSDVVSTSVVFLGLRIAKKPPDRDHPYGHGEADTLAAFFVSIILLLTGGYMTFSTLQIFIHRRFQAPTQVALWAAVGSILLKWILYRYTLKTGKTFRSSALVANAYDHKSDAYSSVAALVGIVGARMGWRYLDPLAGLFIAVLILQISFRLLKSNLHLLMEGIPDPSITNEIEKIALKVPGLKGIKETKVRSLGSDYLVDMKVLVEGKMTVYQGHKIASNVKENLLRENQRIKDVMVHVNPYLGG